jgi:uncharacterized membrane protein
MKESTKAHLRHAPRYMLIGVITAAPLWVTWIVFNFLLTLLSRFGSPWINALAAGLRRVSPALADSLVDAWFQSLLAALVALALLYLLGWAVSRVIGRRILDAFEAFVQRIPLVAAIYGGTKRFLSVVKERPSGVQRVVLIPFPTSEMRAVGFVTRLLDDESSGRKIAAVYVPTSPNPTSGYIELVPLDLCTPTDWSVDEAMSFVITGGANAPGGVRFGAPVGA